MAPARILFAPVDEADRFLPEGPHGVAVAGRLALAWVNIQSATASKTGAVHLRFWDTGEHRILRQSARPGFIVPTDRPGVVLVGREKELGTLDLQTGEWKTLARIPDANPRTIINDGAAVPGGRAVVEGQVCSNGKIFGQDADGLTLYDIDTPRRVVSRYRFDLDRRSLQVDGVAVDLRTVDGFPDGMVGVPRAAGSPGDGTAIIAMYNPGPVADGRAYHYHLGNGQRLSEWIVPGSPRVTCPLLVERDGGVKLVLTTAVEGMPAEQRRESPNAGSLFEADTDLKRVPPVELVCLG
jgi:sugar lactone lactonase YvrE